MDVKVVLSGPLCKFALNIQIWVFAALQIPNSIFTLHIMTPKLHYYTCPKILMSSFVLPVDVSKSCWMSNIVDTDQMLCSVASNLGLHYLLRHVCLE